MFLKCSTLGVILYALMYSRAKCLLKVIFFTLIWNIVVMRKKDCIFSNSLNLGKLTKSKMAAMFKLSKLEEKYKPSYNNELNATN